MRWKSSTLDDIESHWQPVRLVILVTAGLLFAAVTAAAAAAAVAIVPNLNELI